MANPNQKEEYTEYDASKLYEEQIRPYISELKKVCKLNDIPIAISCAVTNRGGVTTYVNDGIFTGSSGLKLYDDQFERMLLVMRGAALKPLADIEIDEAGMDYILHGCDDSDYIDHFQAETNVSVLDKINPDKIVEFKAALPEKKKRGRPKKSPDTVVEETAAVIEEPVTDEGDIIAGFINPPVSEEPVKEEPKNDIKPKKAESKEKEVKIQPQAVNKPVEPEKSSDDEPLIFLGDL